MITVNSEERKNLLLGSNNTTDTSSNSTKTDIIKWTYNPADYHPEAHETSAQSATTQNQQGSNEITTAQGNDKFAAFDSLRHQFDTHRKINKTEYIGGLFPRGGITVVGGASGVGKTTLEQKIIHDLSLGGEILGGFVHEDKPRKSIIIAGELGEEGLLERAQEYSWHSDMNFVEVIDLLKFEEKGYSFTINEEAGKANIEHLAQTPGLDVLCLDSFGMFYSGKENDNDLLRAIFHWLLAIARRYNIAIVIIHHCRKRLSSEQAKPLTLDDMIGGNAIARYAHRVIAIEYNALYKANTVTCLKSWGPYFKTFTYRKKPGYYGAEPYLEINLEPAEIETEKKKNTAPISQAENQRTAILAALKAKEGGQITIQELQQILDVNDEQGKSALRAQLKRICDNGEITRPKRGIYALPEHLNNSPSDNNAPKENIETNGESINTDDNSINIDFDDEHEATA